MAAIANKRVANLVGQLSSSMAAPASASAAAKAAELKDHKSAPLIVQLTGGKGKGKAAEAKCTRGPLKKPVRVLITGAAGNIGYSIVFMVAEGQMLGDDQPMHLVLLDIPAMEKSVEGLVMELQDCAYPLLTSITATSDYKTAFTDVEYALLVGARPRGPGMQRKDLLQANAAIFSGQGKALNDYAARNVKVLVVGNPANTNALIAMTYAPDLPRSAFTAMTRLDQARAVGQLAARLKVEVTRLKNVIIWGNHSATQYPDVNHAFVTHSPQPHSNTPVRTAVNDNDYLNGAFIKCIQERGAEIIKVRQKSSAASAAQAAVDHMRDWALGTAVGEYASMGVASDGSYGVPEGLIYSFPCICKNGQYTIVKGLVIDAFSKGKMELTTKELLEERSQALPSK